MSGVKEAVLLVGSPRGKKSNSANLGSYLFDLFENKRIEVKKFWLKTSMRVNEDPGQMLSAIEAADMVVLATPLYYDCAPYIVIKAMELMATRGFDPRNSMKKHFFVIVNSGLPEENHFSVAVRIYKNFAKTIGFTWAGSLCVGSGEALSGGEGKSLEEVGGMGLNLLNTLKRIAQPLSEGDVCNDEFVGIIPNIFLKGFFKWIGWLMLWTRYFLWKRNARKRSENIKAQPYAEW